MPELNPIEAPGEDSGRPDADGLLTIRQINIGQGNLTYIICPNGKRILIDAGSDDLGHLDLEDVAYYMEYAQQFDWEGAESAWKKQTNFLYVDLIILTHSDKDHYNQIPDLVGVEAPIQQIYVGGPVKAYKMTKFRQWYQQYANLATKTNPETGEDEERIEQIIVNNTQRDPILLCDGGTERLTGYTCEVWAIAGSVPPERGSVGETVPNANSLVVKIIFGNTSAIIGGDATVSTENFMLANATGALPLRSNFLLVPHHGSESSSSQAFVTAVSPEIAVVSAKEENKHGLPRKNIIQRYTNPATMLQNGQPDHEIATYTLQGQTDTMRTTKDIWQTGVSGTKSYIFDGDQVTPD